MRLGILSGGTGPHVQDLLRAALQLGHEATAIDFRTLSASVNSGVHELANFDALIVRTMPAGSLEQVVFRMDLLHECQARGQLVVNSPKAVEVCVDKFLTSARLARAGIPTPRTVVCQQASDAQIAFAELGGDVVVKPIFGAEGRGMVRVSDAELAWRTFRAIEQTGGVIYLQEFITHPGWDVRVFVLGARVLGAMRRSSENDWRTNVSQGGEASDFELDAKTTELALVAAKTVGAEVAGVDLMPLPGGGWTVLEVNGVPGWAAFVKACHVDVPSEIIRYVVARA
jgi:RimK family alpha-L-glutamate ligase